MHPQCTTSRTDHLSQPKPAAGYIRVSLKRQAEGESPENQRERILQRAAQEGYTLILIEEDHDRGGRMTRTGYQRILDAARAGVIEAVFVYSLSRWGRNAAERLTRGQELDKLRVKVISVLQGHDRPGLQRAVFAGMDEEYSRQLAANVREAKERSARKGKHQGVTPFGFKRYYAARENSSRYQSGLLIEDETTSWVVKELFSRYATARWSFRRLALWLNSDPTCPRAPEGGDWDSRIVAYILQNPAYRGGVRYNASRFGVYETSEPGSKFVAEGRHTGFIAPELIDAVQRRIEANRKRGTTYNRLAHAVPMGAGVLVCTECGGPMVPVWSRHATWSGQYVCLHRNGGKTDCKAGSYTIPVAHTALLAEMRRLEGAPWNPRPLEHLAEDREAEQRRTTIRRDLERARDLMKQHVRRFSALPHEPTDEEVTAHREVGAEISATIKALEAQFAAIPRPTVSLPDLRSLHDRLTRTPVAAVVDSLEAAGDEAGLRELLVELLERASVVDRIPAKKSKWVRVEVAWARDVQLLLDAGLLTLAPAPKRPYWPSTPQEYERRKYERRKERKGKYWRKRGISTPLAATDTAAAAR